MGFIDAYAEFAVKRPLILLPLSIAVAAGLGAVAFVAKEDVRPEFDKASKGFDTRGTDLAGRIMTREQSIETSQCKGKLSSLPNVTTFNTFARFPDENKPHPSCAYTNSGQTNICRFAYNGICDEDTDGTINTAAPNNRAKCAAGTDCFDCGRCPPEAAPPPPAPPQGTSAPGSGGTSLPNPPAPPGSSSGGSSSNPVPGPPVVQPPSPPNQPPIYGAGPKAGTCHPGGGGNGDTCGGNDCDCCNGCQQSCTDVQNNGAGYDVKDCTGCDSRATCNPAASDWSGTGRRLASEVEGGLVPHDGRRLQSIGTLGGIGYCGRKYRLSRTWSVQLVFEEGPAALLTAGALKGACEVAEAVRSQKMSNIQDCSERNRLSGSVDSCCPDRSLGNIAAILGGKASCQDIDDADVALLTAKLETCEPAFRIGDLVLLDGEYVGAPNYDARFFDASPGNCYYGNLMYDAFNALLDKDWTGTSTVKYAKTMVPAAYQNALLENIHYDVLEDKNEKSFGGAKLTAYVTGDIKGELFSKLLVKEDLPLIGVGIVLIFLTMYAFAGSLFFAVFAFIQVLLSLVFAYGVYVGILNFPFFPFLNLTGVYICIGIGADDIFVFLSAYDEEVRKRGGVPTLDGPLMAAVLREAGSATLVTSLTTAGAFLASSGSSIPSIACFGVYCGLVVLCDWLLMVTYVPALTAIYTKYVRDACGGSRCDPCLSTPLKGNDPSERRIPRSLGALCSNGFLPLLSNPISATLLVLIGLGLGLGLGKQYVDPGFKYPESSELQLLRDSHPMERYCCAGPKVQYDFFLGADSSGDSYYSVTLAFGSKMVDNGNRWDPNSYATFEPTSGFDMTTRPAQLFLVGLCAKARNSSWYNWNHNANGGAGHQCAIETVINQLTIPCAQNDPYLKPSCCGLNPSDFPFEPSLFKTCLGGIAWAFNRRTFTQNNPNNVATGYNSDWPDTSWPARAGYYQGMFTGVWFDPAAAAASPLVFQMTFNTNISYSQNYDRADYAYKLFKDWSEEALAGAPAELAGGYFTSGAQFSYYSLQTALADSARQSIIIAIGIALVVLLFMTRNIIIALFATLAVVLIMGTVSGIVILMGWKQGIIESIIISCGIGMACDFAAHLGFAYREAMRTGGDGFTRKEAIAIAIERMVPALSAAAFSTGVMGLLMNFAGTLFTQRFGVFIYLLMAFGWYFGVCFLLPLLAVVGPTGKWGEIAPCLTEYGGSGKEATYCTSSKASEMTSAGGGYMGGGMGASSSIALSPTRSRPHVSSDC